MVTTRVHGVVYTPPEVAAPMVDLALASLVAGRSIDQILALRVCDPAIGEGAFVVEIVRALADAIGGGLDARRRVAATCVHGADIDPRAVGAARDAVERYVGAPVPELRDHLRVADALATDWPMFDALVANPPYIRQELIGKATKQALRGFAAYDGVADLYVYFVELALRISRRYCLIVPNKWLTAAYGRRLRELVANAGSLERVVDLGRALPVFADADAFSCIIAGTAGTQAPLTVVRGDDAATVADALAAPGRDQPRGRWRAEPWHTSGGADGALADRLASRWPKLGDVVGLPARGVVTGCNRAFVIDDETRARLVDRDPAAAAWIRPFAKGRDMRRWRPAAIDRYLVLTDRGGEPPEVILDHLAPFRDELEPRPHAHVGAWSGRKPGSYRWFELQDPIGPLAGSRQPRLFYQDIQTAPACCLDDAGALLPDTTVWILGSDDRFLLAVLNSRLYGWYARLRFPPALNGAVRPKLEYMRALPLAQPSPDLREHITRLVDAQLAAPELDRDAALDDLVCDAYELSRPERSLQER
jgi:Eco57I restriction-modification methylase